VLFKTLSLVEDPNSVILASLTDRQVREYPSPVFALVSQFLYAAIIESDGLATSAKSPPFDAKWQPIL
jgi:hypothetical protein